MGSASMVYPHFRPSSLYRPWVATLTSRVPGGRSALFPSPSSLGILTVVARTSKARHAAMRYSVPCVSMLHTTRAVLLAKATALLLCPRLFTAAQANRLPPSQRIPANPHGPQHRPCSVIEKCSGIAVAALGDPQQALFSPSGILPGNQAKVGGELSAVLEAQAAPAMVSRMVVVSTPTPGDLHEPFAGFKFLGDDQVKTLACSAILASRTEMMCS